MRTVACAVRAVLIPLVAIGIVISLLSQSVLILIGPILGPVLLWALAVHGDDPTNTDVSPGPFHSRI